MDDQYCKDVSINLILKIYIYIKYLIRKSSGKISRNFFKPPNLSFRKAESVEIPVISWSILPISPTGNGPRSCNISLERVFKADSVT